MKKTLIKDLKPIPLKDHHMPKNFNISLKSYGGGGNAKSLNPNPKNLPFQSMRGFEKQYKNITNGDNNSNTNTNIKCKYS